MVFFWVALDTGATQPWGTISDASGLFFFLVLSWFVVNARRIPGISDWSAAPWVTATGLSASIIGIAGSGLLVWVELGGPTGGLEGRMSELGLGLQTVATVLLAGWCIAFGYLLRKLGWSRALQWGVIGATFVGAPLWFVWLGKRFLEPTRRGERTLQT